MGQSQSGKEHLGDRNVRPDCLRDSSISQRPDVSHLGVKGSMYSPEGCSLGPQRVKQPTNTSEDPRDPKSAMKKMKKNKDKGKEEEDEGEGGGEEEQGEGGKREEKRKKKSIHPNEHVRKLSNVSHRNIQLLSMKPRSERDTFVDNLRSRRRSSLINLILGAHSSGPRFSDDLCSVGSRLSNFGIEFFPDTCRPASSINSLHLDSIEDNPSITKTAIRNGGFLERQISQVSYLTGSGVADERQRQQQQQQQQHVVSHYREKRRRSSTGSFEDLHRQQQRRLQQTNNGDNYKDKLESSPKAHEKLSDTTTKQLPSLGSTALASIDLTSSFERHHDKGAVTKSQQSKFGTSEFKNGTIFENIHATNGHSEGPRASSNATRRRINPSCRILRRSGSELSLYSSGSSISGNSVATSSTLFGSHRSDSLALGNRSERGEDSTKETKLIIILQVCLPFILAGFGNMGAGLVLSKVATWEAFRRVPALIVLLPPLVGLKGNIEMTLASRLSTLSNLNLLDTKYRRRRVYISNLILTISQAIGMSLFASLVAIVCGVAFGAKGGHHSIEQPMGLELVGPELPLRIYGLVVVASALITSIFLVLISSVVMSVAIALARLIQVNPDNLSTLVAALYGDVSCVLVYGLTSNWIYSMLHNEELLWPLMIVTVTLTSWPLLIYCAYKLKETHGIALSSMPPMVASIIISMGSGTVLSLVVGRFRLLALYQPVVNGFSANLIAVQASRVSTWLWCAALRDIASFENKSSITFIDGKKQSIGSLAPFSKPADTSMNFNGSSSENEKPCIWRRLAKLFRAMFWSFMNPSPNSVAARLLLMTIVPAHTIYFMVIWLLSSNIHIVITWQFYLIYMTVCLIQVFILLTLCEPFMTLLMNSDLDPDIFGISILMALADLLGTLSLTCAFHLLATMGDVNASS